MKKTRVSIQFTSLGNLWAFRMAIEANVFEMNMSKIMITCECSKEQIALAISEYKGKLVEVKEEAWKDLLS
jgi:hypothetical protein